MLPIIYVELGEQTMPYEKLTRVQSRIIIGTKQTLKAMNNKEVSEVFIANDADRQLTKPVTMLAEELGIPYEEVDSMKKLGNACGIEVGTSTVAIKR